jgi:hypothetical protein
MVLQTIECDAMGPHFPMEDTHTFSWHNKPIIFDGKVDHSIIIATIMISNQNTLKFGPKHRQVKPISDPVCYMHVQDYALLAVWSAWLDL